MSDSDVPLRQHLRESLKTAMRARDRVTVSVLRSTLAAIDNAEAVDAPPVAGLAIEQSPAGLGAAEVARRHLTEADVTRIVQAEMTDRETAAVDYERAGRQDQADRLRAEIGVLSAHLSQAV
jgi:uncharacterized protein YqeY